MQTYAELTQKNIIDTANLINEINMKFPMLELKDINFSVLSNQYKVSRPYFLSMIVFMDWLKRKKTHLNLYDIKMLKVKRNGHRWQFLIKSKIVKMPLKFEHQYDFKF